MERVINDYGFGRIRIGGREYSTDVVVYPDRVNASWWRREGHNLTLDDLAEVLREPPQVLVIGTGYFGRMQVPRATLDALHARGIITRVQPTREAVDEFNRLQQAYARVVAALHLTC